MAAVDRRRSALFRLGALLAFVLVAVIVIRQLPIHAWLAGGGPLRVRSAVASLWWAPLAFVAGYAALSAVGFSGLLLTAIGGAVFGFGLGTGLNFLGANLGAGAAFWLGRRLGRDGLHALIGARMAAVDRVSVDSGFRWLVRLRLIPLVPFNLLNFAAAFTKMPWRTYILATALGILPGSLVDTYFADQLVVGSAAASRIALVRASVMGAGLIAISFIPAMLRRVRSRAG